MQLSKKKGGGSPQCHLIKTLADQPPRFSLANKTIKQPSCMADTDAVTQAVHPL